MRPAIGATMPAGRWPQAAGTDPGEQRKADKLQTQLEAERAFKRVALAWLEHQTARWAPATKAAVLASLEADAFPDLGPMPITEIRARHVMEVVRKVEARGAGETAARLLQRIRSVFRFAVRESSETCKFQAWPSASKSHQAQQLGQHLAIGRSATRSARCTTLTSATRSAARPAIRLLPGAPRSRARRRSGPRQESRSRQPFRRPHS
jgi:integrase